MSHVVLGLANAGHETYGLVRNEVKGRELSNNGSGFKKILFLAWQMKVIPVYRDIWKSETWQPTAEKVDFLIDAYIFVRAAERNDIIKRQIITVSNSQSESVGDILNAVANIPNCPCKIIIGIAIKYFIFCER
ncbi:hypothetical protein G9A89_009856 [Geosiphon pyriformis]|nr:hypothetical protein G9A89_009856 [Geosiphon pyriformis]